MQGTPWRPAVRWISESACVPQRISLFKKKKGLGFFSMLTYDVHCHMEGVDYQLIYKPFAVKFQHNAKVTLISSSDFLVEDQDYTLTLLGCDWNGMCEAHCTFLIPHTRCQFRVTDETDRVKVSPVFDVVSISSGPDDRTKDLLVRILRQHKKMYRNLCMNLIVHSNESGVSISRKRLHPDDGGDVL